MQPSADILHKEMSVDSLKLKVDESLDHKHLTIKAILQICVKLPHSAVV